MDLEEFLKVERQRLREERERLTPRSHEEHHHKMASNAQTSVESSKAVAYELFIHQPADCNETENARPPTGATTASPADEQSFHDFVSTVGHTNAVKFLKNAKNWANQNELNSARSYDENSVVAQSNDERVEEAEKDGGKRKQRYRKNQDDMEQWVTDTFYSYFPGFNNEYQKRQNLLRERQLENQQNFLKHQALHSPKKNGRLRQQLAKREAEIHNNPTTARSSTSTTTTSTSTLSTQQLQHQQQQHSLNDKTDLEIIVNNPQAEQSEQPNTTRYKLLQDLKHTDLSTMAMADERYNSGAVLGRKRQKAELQMERQKEYQMELLKQIDEKRRSIEKLREKERNEEEASARRLQEQLKTLKLEEQLEKERIRAEKVRFEADHNRRMRENLIRKLEQDTKMLYTQQQKRKGHSTDQPTLTRGSNKVTTLRDDKEIRSMSDPPSSQDTTNKVYQYFSNSARHEYRRGRPMPADVEFDLQLPESISAAASQPNTERECFHLSDKVCPLCDAPLRSYESCCLRCQRKLSLKLHAHKKTEKVKSVNVEHGAMKTTDATKGQHNAEHDCDGDDEQPRSTFSLVCVKCERLYTMCPTCLEKSDVCRACNRQRHVCMSCRRALCSFCLDEVACGRDTERSHINDGDAGKQFHSKMDTSSERSFEVLEVNYSKESDDGDVSSSPLQLSNNQHSSTLKSQTPHASNNNFEQIHNNLHSVSGEVGARPPYSMNIERNSIFHPSYEAKSLKRPEQEQSPAFEQLPKLVDKQLSFDLDSSATATDDPISIERVRKETDMRLSRYLKNYGDLALKASPRSHSESRHCGTQTTPDSVGRRDVVLNEEHNLSMPLLREMPKMTRKDASNLMAKAVKNNQRKMENLNSRWEIPAVQKFTISANSPKVLTQVGAIRKQLQAERFLAQSNTDDDDY